MHPKRYLLILLAVLALSAVLSSSASALPARPAVLKTAEWLLEVEHLEGGSISITGCHPGKQRGVMVCKVGLTGRTEHEGEAVEASCTVGIGAIWHPIAIEGANVRPTGYWTAAPVTLTACEGSPVE